MTFSATRVLNIRIMLINFNVAGDLAGLLLAYTEAEDHKDAFAELRNELEGYSANSRMPFSDWWSALELIAEKTGKPWVGLEIGRCIRPSHCGVIGYLSLSCDSLGEALLKFERYQRLLYDGNQAVVSAAGDMVTISWPYDYGHSTRESDETLMSSMISFVRMLSGNEQIAPDGIGFVHPDPEHTPAEMYREYLGCVPEFRCANTYIRFPTRIYQTPVTQADPVLNELLDQQAESLLGALPDQDQFLQQMCVVLLKAMQDGKPVAAEVAGMMGISERTLHRRLQEKTLSFKSVLLKTREQLAKQYLKEKNLTHAEIALLLGYSEQSAFSRAFRQWTGTTPLNYQKSL